MYFSECYPSLPHRILSTKQNSHFQIFFRTPPGNPPTCSPTVYHHSPTKVLTKNLKSHKPFPDRTPKLRPHRQVPLPRISFYQRDKTRFANFTHYRGSRQVLVQARTLVHHLRQTKTEHWIILICTTTNSGWPVIPWVNNTLWAFRASFEIRRIRRLSRGSADPREYSRSWRLVQSCPAHVAHPWCPSPSASVLNNLHIYCTHMYTLITFRHLHNFTLHYKYRPQNPQSHKNYQKIPRNPPKCSCWQEKLNLLQSPIWIPRHFVFLNLCHIHHISNRYPILQFNLCQTSIWSYAQKTASGKIIPMPQRKAI